MTMSLDEGLALIDQRFDAQQNAPENHRVEIYDKFLQLVGTVEGENLGSASDICNDAGEIAIAMPGEDFLAQWCVEEHVDADIFVVLWVDGKQMPYKVFDILVDENDDGTTVVTPVGLHILDEIKHLQLWPNPMGSIILQVPKVDLRFGNSISVIKSFIHRNLWREQAKGWIPSWDIWDAGNWRANFNNADWQMVMLPVVEPDNSPWTIMAPRMDSAYDTIRPTLDDGGLQLISYIWFPGMPQPCESHFTLTRPTIVFDVIQRRSASGKTGSFIDGLKDLLRVFDSDGTSEDVVILDPNDDPYADPNAPPTVDGAPWVIWRQGQHTGLKSQMVIHKPLEHTITSGGKSPDAVNQGAKLLLNLALGYLGMLIGNPGLGLGIFDKTVEDVLLAWAIFTDHGRRQRMGPYSHKSGFESGGGVAVSPSGLQTGRVGLWKARGYVSFAAGVENNAPYSMGRHIDVGQHCGFEIMNRIWLSNIAVAEYSWDRPQAGDWVIGVGDYRAEEQPGLAALRKLETFSGALRQHASSI